MPRAKKIKEETQDRSDIGGNPVEYVAQPADFPVYYANNALMTLSDLDGSIIFGEAVGKNQANGKPIVIPKVKIIIAAPFAEKLSELFTTQLVLRSKNAKG